MWSMQQHINVVQRLGSLFQTYQNRHELTSHCYSLGLKVDSLQFFCQMFLFPWPQLTGSQQLILFIHTQTIKPSVSLCTVLIIKTLQEKQWELLLTTLWKVDTACKNALGDLLFSSDRLKSINQKIEGIYITIKN